tara:strand:- start:1665 stop:1925 length:261 start_codon:yes stop_codon:yes gene_type:complete
MPLYTFISKGGESIEELVPSNTKSIQRNGTVYFRGKLPEQFSFSGRNLAKSFSDRIKRGYYAEECAQGSGFRSSYSKKKIRKAWGV